MIYRPRHFILEELVCPHVFEQFKEIAWQFFDDKILMTIDLLRDQLGPVYINNWDIGGKFTQRGLRCTKCELVRKAVEENRVYVSPHITGQGMDLIVKNMTAAQVRLWIARNPIKMPFPVRLEKGVTWVHIDSRDAGQKVYLFNP